MPSLHGLLRKTYNSDNSDLPGQHAKINLKKSNYSNRGILGTNHKIGRYNRYTQHYLGCDTNHSSLYVKNEDATPCPLNHSSLYVKNEDATPCPLDPSSPSGIIGSKEFVSANYQRFKNLFESKHEKKPKPIKDLDGIYSLKRLSEVL